MDHTYVPANIIVFILHVKLFDSTVLNICVGFTNYSVFCRFISFFNAW